MSNDLGANMRRAKLDRESAQRRHENALERARQLARTHQRELDRLLASEYPRVYVQQEMAAAYALETKGSPPPVVGPRGPAGDSGADRPWRDPYTGARFAEQNRLTEGYVYDPEPKGSGS